MKNGGQILALLALTSGSLAFATPVSLTFGSAPAGQTGHGGQISFSNSQFTFLNASSGSAAGRDLQILYAPGEAALQGLFGDIMGTWTIGSVTTSADGLTETANVTTGNPGTFRIYQDSSHWVDALISFFTIATVWDGVGGIVSGNGDLNVSGWTKHGTITNSGLNDLISQGSGTSTIGFTFLPALDTLSQLKAATTPKATAFGGTLSMTATSMPEPSEFALISIDVSGLGLLVFFLRRRTPVGKGV